jgi:hypothetical protein
MPGKAQTSFASAIVTAASMVAVLFFVKGVETLFHLPLEQFGIIPRTVRGLLGIFFSPLLHGNMHHLLANSVPLFVLLVLLLSNPKYHPYIALSFIWIASGLGTWLIGRGDAVLLRHPPDGHTIRSQPLRLSHDRIGQAVRSREIGRDARPLGCRVGRQQLGCYAQDSTAGGVPLTLRNMVRTLDALIPCGPRSGHGCGITCIGAGSGCLGLSCHRDIAYCPLCGAPPFACTCYCDGCIDSPPSRPWIQEPTFEDAAANGNGPRESKTETP